MILLALILAIAAIILFVVEAARTRLGLIPIGLALLTAAWVVQLTVEGELHRW